MCGAVYLKRAEPLPKETSPSALSPAIIYLCTGSLHVPLHTERGVYLWLAVQCITKHIHNHLAIFGVQCTLRPNVG